MKIIHYYKVASHFSIYNKCFWLALFHDTVEDGYLPKILCRYWKGLDVITRRSDETYFEHIERVKLHKIAKKVKLADLEENLKRCSESLAKRYVKAKSILLNDSQIKT